MSNIVRRALFADLVFNEDGQPAKAVYIGQVPHYSVPDGDFLRHVEAEHVDRQIVALMQERVLGMSDAITEGMIHMMGEENLFTRASVKHAIENMDRILEPGAVDVDELRTALWMTKFRAVVDVHGNVVLLEIPGWEDGEI
ncbi:MAG: hypothetical protein DRJ03_11255 [Chloroflexi bacterium]|nr:MAG: hypothetical protein B6I35_07670 [Anaerolineaceae bacterium 4572_32.2]RLC80164.1 MAG: hypothetical protein DRI81_04495 [Chloroflexota bacterium]RLC85583.1 MAG: hypothetical protein DRJ03_11255 [Chloroflexota bacterium]HEY71966.1 hypothetical protein [Thermoflexia bacterium]